MLEAAEEQIDELVPVLGVAVRALERAETRTQAANLGLDVAKDEAVSGASWALIGLLVFSGLTSLIAFSRVGIQRFWAPRERPSPVLRRNECLPILILLGVCIVLTFKAEPLLRYTQDTAAALHDPQQYVLSVMSTRPIPGPTTAVIQEVQP